MSIRAFAHINKAIELGFTRFICCDYKGFGRITSEILTELGQTFEINTNLKDIIDSSSLIIVCYNDKRGKVHTALKYARLNEKEIWFV